MRDLGPATLPDGCELPFAGGLIGLLNYDFGTRLERLPQRARDDSGLPLARLGLYGWALITDHQRQASQLLFHPATARPERERLVRLFETAFSAAPEPFRLHGRFTPDISRDDYRRGIERIQAYIQAGDCYQVNFTQRFRAACSGDAWSAYSALRKACPTPFAGFVGLGDGAIVSLSPERFLRLQGGRVETRPIKGTRPRGHDEQSDAAQAQALLASEKDRAENLMIVDLLRNDLGRSCRIGSVRVPQLFALESYPNVHHLVSCVTGELADRLDAFDLLAGSFPGGSITGAPKIRAMQIIDELEPTRRSIYCGSLLYVDVRGNGQLHRHPYPARPWRTSQLLGRWRHRRRLGLAGGIPGVDRQGEGAAGNAGAATRLRRPANGTAASIRTDQSVSLRFDALRNSCLSASKVCTAGNCGNSAMTLSGAWNRMPAWASLSMVVSL